ncbi:hypothetical protein [Nonomuraea sp. NPDC050310]|uniref:hypothetical protein n=1 Tax=unclassified Nonomuraea TaxID=2593643 RepID=UPI0033F5211F
MRNSLSKAGAFALLAPLAGGLLFTAAPAAAAAPVTTTAVVAKTADDPYSVFDVKVRAPKAVKAGGTIKYRISAVNTGPHHADYYYIGGQLPKGLTGKIKAWGPDGTACTSDSTGFWCWGPYALDKGYEDWLIIEIKLSKRVKGVATAKLGALVYDIPTGMEKLNKEEIDRLGGVNSWFYGKSVKTKIVR